MIYNISCFYTFKLSSKRDALRYSKKHICLKKISNKENEKLFRNFFFLSVHRATGGYVPIAPKPLHNIIPEPAHIILKAVNVPVKEESQNLISYTLNPITPTSANNSELPNQKETIRLYSNLPENGELEFTPGSLPVLGVDVEEGSLSISSGLSPWIKFHNKKPKQAEDPTAVPKSQEITSTQMSSDPTVRRTPRSLIKSRSKSGGRLSLSEPRKNAHIRALDFDATPAKMSTTKKKIHQSQQQLRSKSVCRSGLFQSPPFSGAITEEPRKETKSPAPKLKGDWSKYTGVDAIIEVSSTKKKTSPQKLSGKPKDTKAVPKKSWDSDLRKNAFIDEKDQLPKLPKIKKKKTNSPQPRRKSLNNIDDQHLTIGTKSQQSKVVNNIQDRVKRVKTPKNCETKSNVVVIDESPKKVVNSSENTNSETITRVPDMMVLDTPRKEDSSMQFPPTPRLHTPGNSLIQFASKMSEGKSIDFIDTPDFPVTPCITFTPKHVEEAEEKKPSPYYEPEVEAAKDAQKRAATEITEFEVHRDCNINYSFINVAKSHVL